ncbi:putative oxidoreductase [Rhodoligotrophos appendicifer]|uniref:DoxX family protein n=1 Tax=Rhodoligotrophos appendicifer TaxID=987056 RepID=UPI001185B606|nr:DoxX family protein [Rhodoligotrophos appendicifer]
MASLDQRYDDNQRLIVPAMSGVYAALSPLSYALMRVLAGGLLAIHGFPKILDPMARIGMVEGLGFYPGVFWAPLLAITEFFGGILIALGLLTRPAAFAGMIVLLVTVYFHWIVQGEGLMGAEKSILWAAILFFFAVHGGGRWSVDAKFAKTL